MFQLEEEAQGPSLEIEKLLKHLYEKLSLAR